MIFCYDYCDNIEVLITMGGERKLIRVGSKAKFFIIVLVVILCSGCLGGGSTTTPTFGLLVTVLNDATGTPILGAMVKVVGKDVTERETNASGQVRFSKLSGSVELLVEAPGFLSKTERVEMTKEQSITLRLAMDATGTVVRSAQELAEAIADEGLTRIVLAEDVVLEKKLVIDRPVQLDLQGKTLTGDVDYVFTDPESVQLTGAGQINGNLTVDAPQATISSDLHVTGIISILAVAGQTWNDYQSGNEYAVSANNVRINLHNGATAIHFTESAGDNLLFVGGTVERFVAHSSVEVVGANQIVHATVHAQGVVFDYSPGTVVGSEIPEILNPDPDDPEPQPIAGPRLATVSKRDGAYFNFETGETATTPGEEDFKLTWVQNGNEYTLIGFEHCMGIQFGVDLEVDENDLELVLNQFRTVTAEDWNPSEVQEEIRLTPYDTLILKTKTNRLVKLFILEIRGHWQHEDAAAVDFVYLFLDEVDETPPEIGSVTLVTESGAHITRYIHDGVITFEIDEDPEEIYFSFNEVVYANRPLARDNVGSGFSPSKLWFSARTGYLGSPYFAREFDAGISVYGMSPPWSVIELSGGEEDFYEDLTDDKGHFFADLLGNQMVELPFEKILIKRVDM